MVGAEAAEARHLLDISYPVREGIVTNWEEMEHIWKYTFQDQLGVQMGDLGDHNILITEPPLNPVKNRAKMLEVVFEKYGFGGCRVSTQAVLVLYAQGLMSGLVVDSGDGVTHVVPVCDGYVVDTLINRTNIAGRHITEYLIKLLLMRGYAFNRSADFETVARIKQELSYVAYDINVDRKLAQETTTLIKEYQLPDGRKIKFGDARFEAPELLFNPELDGHETKGMHTLIHDTIQGAAIDLRSDLYKHIVLSGGTTMFPGLPSRLEKEIKALYCQHNKLEKLPAKFKMRIEDPPRRKHLVFLGGSYLADIMQDKSTFWVSKAEYEEDPDRCLNKLSGIQ